MRSILPTTHFVLPFSRQVVLEEVPPNQRLARSPPKHTEGSNRPFPSPRDHAPSNRERQTKSKLGGLVSSRTVVPCLLLLTLAIVAGTMDLRRPLVATLAVVADADGNTDGNTDGREVLLSLEHLFHNGGTVGGTTGGATSPGVPFESGLRWNPRPGVPCPHCGQTDDDDGGAVQRFGSGSADRDAASLGEGDPPARTPTGGQTRLATAAVSGSPSWGQRVLRRLWSSGGTAGKASPESRHLRAAPPVATAPGDPLGGSLLPGDSICATIERAFPRAFPERLKRKCRWAAARSRGGGTARRTALGSNHRASFETGNGGESGSGGKNDVPEDGNNLSEENENNDASEDANDVSKDGNDVPEDGASPSVPYLGSDRDEHGCIVSAGYTWCESLGACHRPWESPCEGTVGPNAKPVAA